MKKTIMAAYLFLLSANAALAFDGSNEARRQYYIKHKSYVIKVDRDQREIYVEKGNVCRNLTIEFNSSLIVGSAFRLENGELFLEGKRFDLNEF